MGLDVMQSVITITQMTNGEACWRINYGPKDYSGRRGGDLIIDVDPRLANIGEGAAAISFEEWYSSVARPTWKLGRYWLGRVTLTQEVRDLLERKYGSYEYNELMDDPDNLFREDD